METNLDNLAAQVARHGLGNVGLLVDLEQVLGAHPHLALPALEVLLGVVATHVDRQVGTLLPAQGTLPPAPTPIQVTNRAVDPNTGTLNLGLVPGVLLNLDPDPGLCYQF